MQRRKDNKGRVLKEGESYRKTDGLYMYRWTSKDKKRHTVYSSTLEGLREKEEKILRDLRDGIKIGEKSITVNDVYQMWKNDKTTLKGNTKTNYVYMYEHYVQDGFGNITLQDVTKVDVRRLYNQLIDKNGLAIATVDTIHTVLHQVFEMAKEMNLIRTNPSDRVMGDCKKAHNYEMPKRRALTIPQQKAFIDYIKNTPKYKHWLPLFTIFLGTGCRVGEIVGLTWNDVDMDKGLIHINHTLVYYEKEKNHSMFSITTPKTKAGGRTIPMMAQVKEALMQEKEYQNECELECKAMIDGYTDFVFLNRFGMTHNPQTINRTIKRITLAYNEMELDKAYKENREPLLLPKFSCHNLRHTFCTRYCEVETNLKVIQEVMGHKDIATTMEIYAEATQERVVESFTSISDKMYIA